MYFARLCTQLICSVITYGQVITRFESRVTMLFDHYTVYEGTGMSALDCVKFMPIFLPLTLICVRVFMVSIDELNCLKT